MLGSRLGAKSIPHNPSIGLDAKGSRYFSSDFTPMKRFDESGEVFAHDDLTDEALNLNILFLRNIGDLLTEVVNSAIRRDIEAMYDLLEVTVIYVSPKIDTVDLRRALQQVGRRMPHAIQKDEDGDIVRISPFYIRQIRSNMMNILEVILKRLDREGLLTFGKQDKRRMMSKFSSA